MGRSIMDLSVTRSTAVLLLIVTALMWSSAGLLIKLIPWHPIAIAGGRSAAAAIVFLAVMRKPKWDFSRAQLGAAAAYAVTVTSLVVATKMTTAANAVLLQYTAPVYVALFGAWFLQERTTRADWVSVLAVLAGMILFFLDKLTAENMIGNIYGLISGMSFGVFVLLLRKQKDGSTLESVLLGNILTALISVFFVFGQPLPDAAGWAALAALGVFQLGIPYVLYCLVIKNVTALDAILIPVIEPVFNPVWVFLLLDEIPGQWALMGGFIVLCSVTVRCLLPVFARKKTEADDQVS